MEDAGSAACPGPQSDRSPEAEWEGLRDRLRSELAGMADGEFVIVALLRPRWPAPKRAGLLARLFRSGGAPDGQAYVQFLRIQHVLHAECVGAKEISGSIALTPAQREQILALGWAEPSQLAREIGVKQYEHSPNFVMLLPSKEVAASPQPAPERVIAACAGSAAELAIDTLRGPFGAIAAADIDITRQS